MAKRRRSFEVDLRKLDDRYVDNGYARELYAALCNKGTSHDSG